MPIRLKPAALATLTAWTMGVAALLVYALTLYRTVPGGDSGEFITTAYVWGTAHPPGYPFYTVLAHLFTLIPHGSIAWRVNFLSAVCDSLAAGFLTSSVITATRNLIPRSDAWISSCAGFFAGGLFAFSPIVWRYATQAEVFPLNNFFVAISLYFTARYYEKRERPILYLASLVAGTAIFNHQTFLFCAIPLMIWLALNAYCSQENTEPKNFQKEAWICAGLFAAGILPYLYLPIADSFHSPFAWGDLASLKGFSTHFFRREYGTFRLGTTAWKSKDSFIDHLGAYFASLPIQSLGVFFVLALPGLWLSWRKYFWLPVSYFSYLVIFASLSNSRLDLPLHRATEARFWEQPALLMFFWCGIGFAWGLSKISLHEKGLKTAAIVLALVPVTAQATFHYKENDHSTNTVIEDFGRLLLETLEQKSILIVSSDVAWNTTQYLQLCEGFRTDVQVLPQELMTYIWMKDKIKYRYPDIVVPGDYYLSGKETGSRSNAPYDKRYEKPGYSMLEFLNANSRFPIYLTLDFRDSDQATVLTQYERIPVGLFDRVISLRDPARLDKHAWLMRANKFWSRINPTNALKSPEDTWENYIGLVIQEHRRRVEALNNAVMKNR